MLYICSPFLNKLCNSSYLSNCLYGVSECFDCEFSAELWPALSFLQLFSLSISLISASLLSTTLINSLKLAALKLLPGLEELASSLLLSSSFTSGLNRWYCQNTFQQKSVSAMNQTMPQIRKSPQKLCTEI